MSRRLHAAQCDSCGIMNESMGISNGEHGTNCPGPCVANGTAGQVELQAQAVTPASSNESAEDNHYDAISRHRGRVGRRDIKFAILFVVYFTIASWVLLATSF